MNIDFIRCETCPGRVPVVCDYCFRCPECCGSLHRNSNDCWECAECEAIAASIEDDDLMFVDFVDDDDPFQTEDDDDLDLEWINNIRLVFDDLLMDDDDLEELLWEVD